MKLKIKIKDRELTIEDECSNSIVAYSSNIELLIKLIKSAIESLNKINK